ncbi:transglycosylase domain-containing protein [Oceanobacillus alkalisoli]|uniref:transglycosylase domain-containing protein n=1 Tax=Oceanobacillus alkalisoli TaxID=2925113 RepID=UPI001F11F738|nr:transglycosylase domain-containing protein [Oceanobacillus alkalisoli]MCF3943297.1 penicillin-binding protein [Oceanobacillus alkalisoli]
MDFKKSIQQFLHTIKESWKIGKIQKTSRITYGVMWNVILFFLIISFIGMFFVGGIGAGYFASLVKDEKILDYETMAQDIYDYAETTEMYFADNVFLGEVNSDLHRDETTLETIAPELISAVIATEDEYFNEHQGVVPKAILRAVLQEVMNSSTQTGGSTLTQQLIKNQILTNEVSFERKAKEILLALRLERFFEKDEILEAYLNIVPYGRDSSGRNIAGVQTAAQGIFGLDAKDVNLAQAAYLAGLPQSPSAYTPFVSGGGLKDEEGIQYGLNRMKTVLNRMLDMEYITQEEYDAAINYDLVADFKEDQKSSFEEYPVLTAQIEKDATDILYNVFLEEDGVTKEDLQEDPDLRVEYKERAARALQMNGYEIHSTIDKELYDVFQEIGQNFNRYGNNKWTEYPKESDEWIEQAVQGAAIMIENSTGRIISFFGNRNPSIENHYNYSTQAIRSNGSAMKPFIYGSAMEEGQLQPGTPIADVYLTVPDGGGRKEIKNIDLRHHGLLSARTNLAKSYNIPAVKAYLPLIDLNPVDKYLRNMGITTIEDEEYANASFALGGLQHGISIEENTNAFATFANNGQFANAYMIEKITTKDGDTIYEHEVKTKEVFSPQTSYLLIDMMRDVISDGTAAGLRSKLKYSNVDWAGKTGTSQNTENVHFVASNPNITFATWMGYRIPDGLEHLTHSERNRDYWTEFINAASDVNPELVAPDHAFQQPDGIVQRSYCAISGLLPSDLCEKAGLVKTDLFNAKFVPTEVDNSLITGDQIIVNGKAVSPGPDTPGEFAKGGGLMFNPEFLKEKGYDKIPDITQLIPLYEDRSKWEKIGFPNTNTSTNSISDDGKAPEPPTSIKNSGNQITWNASPSNDVVGYRIYRAAKEGDSFSRIGSTTSTSFKSGSGDGIYHIRAVDYFGLESKASTIVTIGKVEDDKEKDKEKDKENEETSEEESRETDEKEEKAKDKDEAEEDKQKEDNEEKEKKEENEDDKETKDE